MFLLHAVNWIMGCMSRQTLHLVIALCCVFVVRGAPVCTTVCSEGQYCLGAECQPCPSGTFQSDPVHLYHSCKPWTTKLPGSHYILVKNGTATSDAVWRCQDNYNEREYTVGGFECVEVETTWSSTPASSSQITTAESTHTTEPTTASLQSQQEGPDLSNAEVAGIILGVLLCVVLLGLVIFFAYRRQRQNIRFNYTNGGTAELLMQKDSPTKSEPQTLSPNSVNYRFCLQFVEKLDVNKFKSFLYVLYDPSGKFDAQRALQIESSKTSDVNDYLTRSFLSWVMLNHGIYRPLIVIALEDIGRSPILEEIEELVPFTYQDPANNVAVMEYIRASTAGNETSSSSVGRKVLRQDRFRLYYYLTKQIEHPILIQLLRQLPGSSDRFNAYSYYEGILLEETVSNAFAQTLEEWWLQNRNQSLKDFITDFLRYEERPDLLANRELQNRLQRIVPAETSSTDILGQEQYHSQNSASDEINTSRVSDSIETEHLLNDTDREHTSNNTSGNQVSNNSEGGHLSNNSEGGNLSNTEGGHLANNSEGGHLSNNSEGGHLSDNTDGGPLSNNTQRKDVLNNTKVDHVSNNAQSDRMSNKNRRPVLA